ncbi:hypothetical protein FB451DRAFT_684588 [Mycena latifolia]|nr:hypothetical protein FB451DRAFT_684588 [Mycena latifolia]
MPGIELTPDILGDIMLRASSIDEKFALAQVSQLWRNIALSTPLLWSSFTGGSSRADCYRIPLMLERSGSTSMLYIQLRFTNWNTVWPADTLRALVPYVPRIEKLDVEFKIRVNSESLLGSNLQFPALHTLRLKGSRYSPPLSLSLSAPQLRALDIEHFEATNWDTLWVPSLENLRLFQAGDAHIQTLLDIFTKCPLVWRVVFHSQFAWDPSPGDHDFQGFARRPLAPALRELELRLAENDLKRLLMIGFSDVVLDKLTGSIYGSDENAVDFLARTLLLGVGPLLVFDHLDGQEIVLRDEGGHTRRLQSWNGDTTFNLREVWRYFSTHYDLHKTVREIRVMASSWDDYIASFELYPPSQDDVTLAVTICREDDEDSEEMQTQIMRIDGLTKVRLNDTDFTLTLKSVFNVLTRLEAPGTHKVEVCMGNKELKMAESLPLLLPAFEKALTELHENWVLCSHCLIARMS